jgi:SAM-dependent methyltransferase
MLQQLKKRASLIDSTKDKTPYPVVAKAQEIPIQTNSVDVAWCYATLLLMPDQKIAISEIVRIVKGGGIIILDIGNVWNLGWIYWKRFYKKLGFPGIFPLSLRKIRKLAGDLGCDIVENVPTGLFSQLLYLPLVDKRTNLRRQIHALGKYPDLDARWSARFPVFANRYYVVLKKKGD